MEDRFIENEVIIKKFEIDGEQSWVEATRRTVGVLRIFPDELSFEVELISGCDPRWDDLLSFVLLDKDVRRMIRCYQQKGRKKPFCMRRKRGMSGCTDWYIDFPDEYWMVQKSRHLMHISCYGKVSGISKIYVGDFAETVGFFMRLGHGKFEKTSAKYVKPYFVDEIRHAPCHLI